MQVMQNESLTQLEIMPQLRRSDRPESGAAIGASGEVLQNAHQRSLAGRDRALYIAETAFIVSDARFGSSKKNGGNINGKQEKRRNGRKTAGYR